MTMKYARSSSFVNVLSKPYKRCTAADDSSASSRASTGAKSARMRRSSQESPQPPKKSASVPGKIKIASARRAKGSAQNGRPPTASHRRSAASARATYARSAGVRKTPYRPYTYGSGVSTSSPSVCGRS